MRKFVLTVSVLLVSTAVFAQQHTSIRSNLIGIVPVMHCPTREVVEKVEKACAKIGADFTYFAPLAGQGNCETWKPFTEVVRTDPKDPDLVTYVFNGPVTMGFCYQND